MGRDVVSVILGGAGTAPAPKGEAVEMEGEVTTASVDQVADALLEAKNIIITPGYGLAVAQGQFAIADIAKNLKAMGKNVRFGIHPVSVGITIITASNASSISHLTPFSIYLLHYRTGRRSHAWSAQCPPR